MTFHTLRSTHRAAASLVGAASLLLIAGVAGEARALETTGPGAETTVEASDEDGADKALPLTASLRWETAVGVGTFVKGAQNNDLVASTITPTLSWRINDELRLSGTIYGTWYQVVDYGTSLPDNEFLWSDLALKLSAPDIWSDDDLGLKVHGSFSVYLPTSLASRFQTRLFSVQPSAGLTWSIGPVRIGTNVSLSKYFTRSSTPEIDCSKWPDGSQCPGGRDPNDPTFENDSTVGVGSLFGPAAGGAFSGVSHGGEVWIPSSGVNSFGVSYGLNVAWEIVSGLSVSGGLSMAHYFGVRSFEDDALSSGHARAGRNQTDRLTSTVGLDYQIMKHLGVGTSLTTSTIRPLGAKGDDFVAFDFERAPDNITTWNFSVSGTY
ncbi:MAG: hypothetical protein ACQEXJ_21635 [Myxococcota bacterium]